MEENLSSEDFKKPVSPIKELSSDPFKRPNIPISNETAELKDPILSYANKESADLKIDEKPTITSKKPEKSSASVPLPYEEPEWSGDPPTNYYLEIIKNGTIVSSLPLNNSVIVFGRLDVCEVVFEHPSVSRFHAVIQYCKGDDAHPKGFYLYDLGSTHGTFLNKDKVKSKIYYKLKVGYILKFGGSSRLHIFQGPEEIEEENHSKQTKITNETEEEVCNWGMGEEAEEEEDLEENPFALATPNEELYLEDPKKTLRGWFEREGYELEYSVEEKGFRTFSCTIRLPVDNPTGEFLPVEASVGGKKKEAVVACALEACRTLDRLGLLRQSHQEGRQRKRKKWEENDYYDSDEDTFYDRTGEIEKRREMRKRLAKKVQVDNFESIGEKLKALNSEMDEIRNKISDGDAKNSQTSTMNESDPLDMYMSKLSEAGGSISDKFERRKLKLRLIELEKQKSRLEKLSDIARPARLPPVAKHPGIIGKKSKTRLKLEPSPTTNPIVVKNDNKEQIEEIDSDEEMGEKVETKEHVEEIPLSEKYGLIMKPTHESSSTPKKLDLPADIGSSSSKSIEETVKKNCENIETFDKKSGLKETLVAFKNPCLNDSDETIKVSDSSVMSEDVVKSLKQKKKRENPAKLKKVDVYKSGTSEYCTWMPPLNQSGDGRTHLNDKYGY